MTNGEETGAMKKYIALMLVMVLIVLASCGGGETKIDEKSSEYRNRCSDNTSG